MRLHRSTVILAPWLIAAIILACASPSGAAPAASPAPVPPTAPAASSPPVVPATLSTANGLYTEAQATRGKRTWQGICASCHTTAEHADSKFAEDWRGRSLLAFYQSLYTTMPKDDPGTLSEEEYMDVIAYLLKLNRMPAGAVELQADTAMLKRSMMEFKPPGGR
jgi:mono/diheme cytochrome c family protein